MKTKPLDLRKRRNNRVEGDTKKAILDYMNMRGHIAIRVNSGKIFIGGKYPRMVQLATEGTADIIGCRKSDGKFFSIEVKKLGEEGKPSQRDFRKKVDAIPNTITILAYTVDDVIRGGL